MTGLASDRKATLTLATLVLCFAVCWIPYFVLFTIKPFVKLNINVHLDLFCLWLGYVNSTINPFLYGFYNSGKSLQFYYRCCNVKIVLNFNCDLILSNAVSSELACLHEL